MIHTVCANHCGKMIKGVMAFAALTLTVAALVCGCGQKQTNATPSQHTRTPITGAFGFRLGAVLPPSVQTTTDEDGAGIGAVIRTTNFAPFDSLLIEALPDRKIHTIGATYLGRDSLNKTRIIMQALDDKYGPHTPTPGMDAALWTDGSRTIKLSGSTIFYTDSALTMLRKKEKD